MINDILRFFTALSDQSRSLLRPSSTTFDWPQPVKTWTATARSSPNTWSKERLLAGVAAYSASSRMSAVLKGDLATSFCTKVLPLEIRCAACQASQSSTNAAMACAASV
eukprot:9449945-Lingulodinium_polyedra.AAC.1